MKMFLQNSAGHMKEVKVGFSWTTLFFGIFVPIYRGDWKWAIIQLLAGLVSCGISWLVFPFIYNRVYINDLLMRGYKPMTEFDHDYLRSKNFNISKVSDK